MSLAYFGGLIEGNHSGNVSGDTPSFTSRIDMVMLMAGYRQFFLSLALFGIAFFAFREMVMMSTSKGPLRPGLWLIVISSFSSSTYFGLRLLVVTLVSAFQDRDSESTPKRR